MVKKTETKSTKVYKEQRRRRCKETSKKFQEVITLTVQKEGKQQKATHRSEKEKEVDEIKGKIILKGTEKLQMGKAGGHDGITRAVVKDVEGKKRAIEQRN